MWYDIICTLDVQGCLFMLYKFLKRYCSHDKCSIIVSLYNLYVLCIVPDIIILYTMFYFTNKILHYQWCSSLMHCFLIKLITNQGHIQLSIIMERDGSYWVFINMIHFIAHGIKLLSFEQGARRIWTYWFCLKEIAWYFLWCPKTSFAKPSILSLLPGWLIWF